MNDQKTLIKKSDIVYHLLKGWRIILLFTVVGLLIGILLIGAGYVRGEMTKQYKVNASVVVVALDKDNKFSTKTATPYKTDVDIARQLTEDAVYIIKSRKNMQNVIDELDLRGVSPSTISSNLSLGRYGDTEIIEMSLQWRSEREGIAIMDSIIKNSDNMLIDTMKIGRVSVIDQPKASYIVGGNIGISTWIYSAIIGLVAGVLFCLLRFIFGATVINGSDLDEVFGIDLLAALPYDKQYAMSKNIPDDYSPISDDFKSLAHMLVNRMALSNVRRVYITSTEHKEGRTGLIANVAYHLADLGKKTLLIDCDLKNPQLGTVFGRELEYEQTLNALYRGDSDRLDAVLHIKGCLDLLPVILEKAPENFNDAMLGAIEDLMDDYDYVLIDAAPIGADAEVLRLNEITDAVLFVVKSDYATVENIKKAVRRLNKSGIPIIGGVFNASSSWKDAFKRTKKGMDALDKAVKTRRKREKKNKENA